jgi:hypothetical protein
MIYKCPLCDEMYEAALVANLGPGVAICGACVGDLIGPDPEPVEVLSKEEVAARAAAMTEEEKALQTAEAELFIRKLRQTGLDG